MTKYIFHSARLHEKKDREVIDIIDDYKKKGYSFKEIASSAILRAKGIDPVKLRGNETEKLSEMFSRFSSNLESIVAAAIQNVIDNADLGSLQQAKRVKSVSDDDDDNDNEISDFAMNLARGFLERHDNR